MQRAPAWGPFLFRRDRVQQRGRVIVVPDQGGEVVAVRLERNRLLIHVEIDVLERPGAELAVAKAGLEPAVRLTGGEERRCRVIDRSQDSELGFEFLDDRDRGALRSELAFAKAALEPAVRLTGGEERRCRVIDRSQDSELGFEFLDDRDRGAL